MKNDKGLGVSTAWKTILFSVLLSAANQAAGQVQFQYTQWNEPDPPSAQKVLSSITFDQYSSGAYNIAYSESWSGIYATPQQPVTSALATVSGPGLIGIGPATGFGSGQSAVFTGFQDNGGTGYIAFSSSILQEGYFDGLSFDIYSEELPGGLHGPTSFYVQISTTGTYVSTTNFFDTEWQSELIQLVPGVDNAIHWDISNPDGNDANGDGIAVLSPLPVYGDWRSLVNRTDLEVRIVASGANSSLAGLVLDNLQITGTSIAPVPEPSSCLLIVLGMLMIGGRSRRKT